MNATRFLPIVLLAILETCISADPVSFTFTDTHMFYDISLYNFYLGRDHIYEYKLTAREGRQVNLYLFQNNVKQYAIHVYDGQDDTATEISLENKIPANVNLVEEPEAISSTAKYMFIRITADNTDRNAVVDFQAMATDYIQTEVGCSKLVKTINKPDSSYTFSFADTVQDGCYHILHANDPSNNPMLSQTLQNGYNTISDSYSIYKGLYTDAKHLLVSSNLLSWYWATDKYLVLHLTESVDLGYYWTFLTNLDVSAGVGPYTHDVLMTNDYYQDSYPNVPSKLTQTFTIKRYAPASSIQIDYLNFMGIGSVIVKSITSGVTSDPTIYKTADFILPFNVTYDNCDEIILQYTTDNRQLATGSGFYFLYNDASVYQIISSTKAPTPVPEASTTSHDISTTTQRLVTGQPVESTTNAVGSTICSFVFLYVTCILSLS